MVEYPKHLSPSSAAAFESCPRRWRFKYVDKLHDPSNEAAQVGTFAHRVLEALFSDPPERRTIDRAKQYASQEWAQFSNTTDYLELELDDDQAKAFRWQGWLAIKGIWNIEDPTTVDVLSTEQRVEAPLGEVPFVGVVDRVDQIQDKLIVSDYKSGVLPQQRWRSDKIQQVMLYAAALRLLMNRLPDEVRLLYLGQRIINVKVTPARVDNAIQTLGRVWSRVQQSCESDRFEPKPGPLCGWCPFIQNCPEGINELIARSEAGSLSPTAPARDLIGV